MLYIFLLTSFTFFRTIYKKKMTQTFVCVWESPINFYKELELLVLNLLAPTWCWAVKDCFLCCNCFVERMFMFLYIRKGIS